MTQKNEYHEQAEQFLKSCDATIDIRLLYTGKHFEDDVELRDIYSFTISTPRGAYSGTFGDSIRNTQRREFANAFRNFGSWMVSSDVRRAKKLGFKVSHNDTIDGKEILAARNRRPHAYDILSCLTKCDPGTLSSFCADFGYSEDSKKAERIYFAVQKEWDGIRRIFTPAQLELLAEIN